MCLPATSLVNFPFSPTISSSSTLNYSEYIYYLDCVNLSFLKYKPWSALKLSFYFT